MIWFPHCTHRASVSRPVYVCVFVYTVCLLYVCLRGFIGVSFFPSFRSAKSYAVVQTYLSVFVSLILLNHLLFSSFLSVSPPFNLESVPLLV